MMPSTVTRFLCAAGVARGPLTPLRLPAIVEMQHLRFTALLRKMDKIVAVCAWSLDVLRRNHAPDSKLALCRVGAAWQKNDVALSATQPLGSDVSLRIGYFGRLHLTKGVDLLINALRHVPDANARLDIYGLQGPEPYTTQLTTAASADSRSRVLPVAAPNCVIKTMRGCDFVAVPSRWLETGPLVALEAFAAGTPVLGARLGGIAELVTDDVDGVLVAPDDPSARGAAISGLAQDPKRVARLRASVRPPRTMDDVAREMSALYNMVLHPS